MSAGSFNRWQRLTAGGPSPSFGCVLQPSWVWFNQHYRKLYPTDASPFSNVVVIATGNGGNSTNAVSGSGAFVPIAGFSADPTNGFWPLTVSFTDTSSGTITNRFGLWGWLDDQHQSPA